VVISADATPGQVQRLLAAGARDYLTKPIDVVRLMDLLESHLGPGREAAA
jgi:CheY-like chemotaxis protein